MDAIGAAGPTGFPFFQHARNQTLPTGIPRKAAPKDLTRTRQVFSQLSTSASSSFFRAVCCRALGSSGFSGGDEESPSGEAWSPEGASPGSGSAQGTPDQSQGAASGSSQRSSSTNGGESPSRHAGAAEGGLGPREGEGSREGSREGLREQQGMPPVSSMFRDIMEENPRAGSRNGSWLSVQGGGPSSRPQYMEGSRQMAAGPSARSNGVGNVGGAPSTRANGVSESASAVVESTGSGRNGSKKGQSKGGWGPDSFRGPDGRPYQGVLGSASMKGSRFEPGLGDTSWINSMSPDWFPVTPLWQAPEGAVMASDTFLAHMSQGWRILLLSDGSVTRHLHLLMGRKVTVDCLEMRSIGHSLLGVPPGTALVAGPRVQRQVLLKANDGTPLAYAASWWAEYEARIHLTDAHTPIWTALQEQRMELYRSLECLYYGHSRELEKLFGKCGPFWARHYLFYHNGRPLTLIYEVFSPSLDEWLGDSSLPDDLYLP